jgi:hypothetical protein
LDHVVREWKGNGKFLKSKALSALLFADAEVIRNISEGFVQKSQHQFFDVASEYNLPIFTSKTKIVVMKGRELIRTKIAVNNNHSGRAA